MVLLRYAAEEGLALRTTSRLAEFSLDKGNIWLPASRAPSWVQIASQDLILRALPHAKNPIL